VVPTDTVYGLAAALASPEAVARLYEIKGRPRSQPCQVLVFAPSLLSELVADLPAPLAAAVGRLLPGTTTCIVPDPEQRFAAASGDAPGSVGIRAPRVGPELARIDFALVATSANDPGGPDPARLDEVPESLRGAAADRLDAGPLPGTASAVVDLRPVHHGGPARLIRPGPAPDRLAALLSDLSIALEGAEGS
jgi:L-threonylcarbamoyladenylate synthase